MLDVKLIDGRGTGLQATVKDFDDICKHNALIVATHPLCTQIHQNKKFESVDYGVDMNVNSYFGLSPENIYDGTDTTLWTLNTITGTAPTVSSLRYYSGTKSLRWEDPVLNSTFELNKGSSLDLTPYSAISFYINVDKEYDCFVVYGYDSTIGAPVGTEAIADYYFSSSTLDIWQHAAIPLEDMNLTNQTVTSIRFRAAASSPKKPIIYMDEVRLEEAATEPGKFIIAPDAQTNYYIESIKLYIVDNFSTILLSNSMYNLSYNRIFGLYELDSGLIIGKYRRDDALETNIYKHLGDFLEDPEVSISDAGYDGTQAFLTLLFTFRTPIELRSDLDESYQIRFYEILTDLLKFRAQASGYYISVQGATE
jgi:hypothetical protein